jgi:type I restriction-modification system DNA methylase subunit
MARKETKEKAIEVTLWESANKLRGSVESAEYKHVVLGLIFLKFASDKFEDHRKKLLADGKGKYIEMPDFYNMSNVFFLEETSRWSYLIKKSKQNDLALLINTALHTIEKNNKALRGALPDNYFSRLGLDVAKLASLLDTINDIDTTKDPKHDLVGKVYEYFLSKFALAEGKGKGEFYIAGNLGEKAADTFGDDQHKDLKADFIMANPPLNQKDWRGENELMDDPRWRGYEVPPKSNANYGWILNMVSKLSENGVAGFILANGALSGDGEEYKIRRKLIENNLVEAILVLPQDMFYTTNISVTVWILNKNKKVQSRRTKQNRITKSF